MEASDQSAPDRPKRWYRSISLSLSAFIMSLTVTLIGAYQALKGAEIVVLPPKQAILYRDGAGSASVLSVMLPIDIMNITDGYGDVLTDASAKPGAAAPAFAYQGTAHAVFTDTSQNAAERCEIGSRCIALPGLLVREKSDELVDLPSGAARSTGFTFPLTPWNCTGEPKACQRYGSFDDALATIGGRALQITVTVSLHSDGQRQIVCNIPPVNTEYLRQIGWVSASCQSARVTGEPFF